MALTEARKGELAIRLLALKVAEEGVTLGDKFRREAGNKAKRLGITTEELMEFAEFLVGEVSKIVFAPPSKKKKP